MAPPHEPPRPPVPPAPAAPPEAPQPRAGAPGAITPSSATAPAPAPAGTPPAPPRAAAGLHAPRPLRSLRTLLFVARCAGAAVLSQALAEALGLPFPLWAALSALVVSQERLAETRASLSARVLGTVVGVVIAVTVHLSSQQTELGVHGRAASAIGLGALVTRRHPRARSCMWTAAIVIYSPDEGTDLGHVAVWRGVEVVLGGLVGALAHMAAEGVLAAVDRRRPAAA